MNVADRYLPPPKQLAVARAPREYRSQLSLLLRFDARLAEIVTRGGEAIVGQMRMAWWRDIIAKPADARPKGEPMVAELCDLEPIAGSALAAAMIDIVDGWDCLLAQDDWAPPILTEHAGYRGRAIFGSDTDHSVSAQWALHDLANLIAVDISGALMNTAPGAHPAAGLRGKRHLSILVMAARQQYEDKGSASGIRLLLHSLTGL